MANGQLITRASAMEHWKLIDNISSTSNGQWINTGEYPAGSIHIIIAGTATVKVVGSDEETMPANTSHGAQIGSDVTATDIYAIVYPPQWLKAYISAHSSGAVDVFCTLRRS